MIFTLIHISSDDDLISTGLLGRTLEDANLLTLPTSQNLLRAEAEENHLKHKINYVGISKRTHTI